MNNRYAALILAAGLSSRMGQLKPLLPMNGSNVLEATTKCFLKAGIQDIYVVLGHEADHIRKNYRYVNDVCIVYNRNYKDGMFTSVQAGVRAMPDDTTAFLMMPGDCPLVRPETVEAILNSNKNTGAAIVRPTYQGKSGHPCLISMRYRREVQNGNFAEGMRTLLQCHAGDIASIPVSDQGILWDMDTPEQYQHMMQQIKNG